MQKHVQNKLAAHLTGCQWVSPTHFQLWVGWWCAWWLRLHRMSSRNPPHHPPLNRVTTFLELVNGKIKYELEGAPPQAKSSAASAPIKTKIMILRLLLMRFLLCLNLRVAQRLSCAGQG